MDLEFNLLPWRQEKKAQKVKNNQIILLSAFLLGVLLAGGYYFFLAKKQDDANAAINLMSSKTLALQPQLNESKRLDETMELLSKKIETIISLQANRASVVHMIEELSKSNSQSLFITELVLNKENVEIFGTAKDDTHISDFMKQLHASKWYKEPELIEIVTEDKYGEEAKRFKVRSRLLFLGEENEKK